MVFKKGTKLGVQKYRLREKKPIATENRHRTAWVVLTQKGEPLAVIFSKDKPKYLDQCVKCTVEYQVPKE